MIAICTVVVSRERLLRARYHARPTAKSPHAQPDILRVLEDPIRLPPILTKPLIAAQVVPAFSATPTPAPDVWAPLGPAPIPNGETFLRSDPVSGRVTAIVVDRADANVAYVGTAQGGLYRTLDGGGTWTQMMDNAPASTIGTPLAIGALALSPDSNTVFVGTGEGNNNFDGAFGSGFYIITNAKSASPTISGPLNVANPGPNAFDAFAGRSITSIAVDPTNPQHIFCGTSFGLRGFYSSDASPARAPRGLYRSLDGGNTWTRLTVGAGTNATVTSVVLDPANPNHAVVAVQGATITGDAPGIYVTNNALSNDAANPPTFTTAHTTPDNTFVKFAVNGTAVLAATGETTSKGDGRLFRSPDGGFTWTEITAAQGFAAGQGFFNVAVAIDPADAGKIYLGGSGVGTFKYSTDGGATFNFSITGLHPDTHAIAVAPSNSSVIYTGNDGGIWRSTNGAQDWSSLNNATFSATQFSDLALHPINRNLALAGTQDNGTIVLQSDGKTFRRADTGDGGYSLIDQSATDTSAVTFYHTYYNRTGALIGTARVLSSGCAEDFQWSFHGIYNQASPDTTTYCDNSSDSFNGTGLSDAVNFYAPQALGPGDPNTWYFGTHRLYRSTDRGNNAAVVSQAFTDSTGYVTPISAIAVAPLNDSVRLVGLNDGRVFATTSGSSSLTQIAGTGTTNATPATRVARIAVDPNDPNVAYLVFTGYGSSASRIQHVWKTTTLSALGANPSGVVLFAPVSNGLPDVSANAIAIDPEKNSGCIYVGTDVGVFRSTDAAATWVKYSAGLPNVAIFGLQLQNANRVLRAATHGRGLYEVTPTAPTPTPVATATPTATPTGTPAVTPTPSPSASATASPNVNARALNISTRLDVGTGENRAIGGFIITGKAAKRVIVRGIGPSLAQSGLSGVLADPVLELHGGDGTLIARNDNWRDTNATQIEATTIAPTDDAEAAIIATLEPGNYTAVMSGKDGSTGIGLIEAYDLDGSGAASRLANISTRGVVQTGGKVVIGGFILGSAQSGADILVRGLGPSLAQQGVVNAVNDTTLELRDSQGNLLLTNDNWRDDSTQAARIAATSIPPQNELEAALVTSLAPGAYTAILAGKNDASGVAIVEIYNLSN